MWAHRQTQWTLRMFCNNNTESTETVCEPLHGMFCNNNTESTESVCEPYMGCFATTTLSRLSLSVSLTWDVLQQQHWVDSLSVSLTWDGRRERKKILKSRYKAIIVGGQRGTPPEAEENTIFFTLKMKFLSLLTHKLLGPSINSTKIVKV